MFPNSVKIANCKSLGIISFFVEYKNVHAEVSQANFISINLNIMDVATNVTIVSRPYLGKC